MILEVLERADRTVQATQLMILASEQDLAVLAQRCKDTAAIIRHATEKLRALEAGTASPHLKGRMDGPLSSPSAVHDDATSWASPTIAWQC